MKKWVLVGFLVLFLFWLFNAFFSSSYATTRPQVKVKTEQHGEFVVKTWRLEGDTWCSRYPNGVLKGWIIKQVEKSPFPFFQVQYIFGPWSGSFCSNKRHLWGIEWGGIPDAKANSNLGWIYYPGDTRKNHVDKKGDYQGLMWYGHFSTTPLPPFLIRHDYPWLKVAIGLDGYLEMSHSCGC